MKPRFSDIIDITDEQEIDAMIHITLLSAKSGTITRDEAVEDILNFRRRKKLMRKLREAYERQRTK